MAEFRMPALGADMDEGTVTEWRVKPGDHVDKGDVVAVVETQKASLEVEIFQKGTIEQIVVPEGTRVPVGTVLATLSNGAAPALAPKPAEAAPQPVLAAAPARAVAVPSLATPPLAVPAGRHLRISPYALRLASELGVEVGGLAGSGPSGAVTEADVRRAAASVPPAVPGAAEAVTPAAAAPPARDAALRAAIAALMARSKREIPHYYLATPIDMSAALGWLERQNESRKVADRLVAAALMLKAVALAARSVPEMNGFCIDGAFRPSEAVHLGVAISLREGGLIAPALHDVDRRSLDEVMRGLLDLVARTRARTLRASEMADPTLTVTNLGDRGVEAVYGVIYPPQVALVGFGRIREQAWAEGGMVGSRPVLTATLAADHRVSDGHRGGLFLAEIDRLLQEPDKL